LPVPAVLPLPEVPPEDDPPLPAVPGGPDSGAAHWESVTRVARQLPTKTSLDVSIPAPP
jgi:hypothetical protein